MAIRRNTLEQLVVVIDGGGPTYDLVAVFAASEGQIQDFEQAVQAMVSVPVVAPITDLSERPFFVDFLDTGSGQDFRMYRVSGLIDWQAGAGSGAPRLITPGFGVPYQPFDPADNDLITPAEILSDPTTTWPQDWSGISNVYLKIAFDNQAPVTPFDLLPLLTTLGVNHAQVYASDAVKALNSNAPFVTPGVAFISQWGDQQRIVIRTKNVSQLPGRVQVFHDGPVTDAGPLMGFGAGYDDNQGDQPEFIAKFRGKSTKLVA